MAGQRWRRLLGQVLSIQRSDRRRYQRIGSLLGTWLMGERMNEFCVSLLRSPIFWVNTHDPVFYNHNTYSVSGVFAFRFAACMSIR
jgi:hypothetical protein